jgi:catenin beta 1
MKVLSICSTNKPALIENGAMQVLTDHLKQPISDRVLINCLITLRNLSDCAIREENLDYLVKKLIEFLLTSNDLNVSICAAGILSNLTCNNDFNKMKFVEFNGIEALVRLMIQTKENREEIFEPIVCSLRHVTNRHANAHKAQETIRFNYGLPIIVQILQSDSNRWPLLKACIGLVRNLALSENNLNPLRELGVIPRMVQLLIKSLNYLQSADKQGHEAIIDDVPMEEIVEGTVGALHQLARDQHNRVIIRELKCIPILVQLLYMNWESIQRVACGCLCELANDKESTELIDQERATDRLTELLRSKDEAIATYAAAVLFRLSEDKSNIPNANFKGELNQNVDYSAYNTIDPYELNDLKNHQNNRLNIDLIDSNRLSPTLVNFNPISPATTQNQSQQQQQQQQLHQPAAWFDTDL